MTIHRAALLLTLLAMTGCGSLAQAGPPQECGFEDAEIAWEGSASLAAVGLEPETDFPRDRRGEVYVTEPSEELPRAYCIVLNRGTNQQATHSGEVPETWELPDAPVSS